MTKFTVRTLEKFDQALQPHPTRMFFIFIRKHEIPAGRLLYRMAQPGHCQVGSYAWAARARARATAAVWLRGGTPLRGRVAHAQAARSDEQERAPRPALRDTTHEVA